MVYRVEYKVNKQWFIWCQTSDRKQALKIARRLFVFAPIHAAWRISPE